MKSIDMLDIMDILDTPPFLVECIYTDVEE